MGIERSEVGAVGHIGKGLARRRELCHAGEVAEPDDGVDFAFAAYRAGGEWELADLAHGTLVDVETLAAALRRFAGEGGALGMVAVDEDVFVLLRVSDGLTRLLLSDVTAADEWALASSAVEFLGLSLADDEQAPAGDLGLLADLGLPALQLAELLDDDDLYPDELLSEVARSLGFGEEFDDAVGLTSA